jgi:hypothetical protein
MSTARILPLAAALAGLATAAAAHNSLSGLAKFPTLDHQRPSREPEKLASCFGEHRIHNPQNRTDQQQVSPLPVVLLAMWMPRI